MTKTHHSGGTTARINLPARFDMMSTLAFRMPFARFICDKVASRLVVDLSGLGYIDSMGIATLLCWDGCCRDKGKTMVLDCCDVKIKHALKSAGVDRRLEFVSPRVSVIDL